MAGGRRGWRAGESGSTAVELVLLTPVVLALTFLPVQAGVLYHARHVVTAAAQEGARAARVVDLEPAAARAAGVERASRFAAQLAGSTVTDTTVTVERGPQQVAVRVRGRALSVLPGLTLTVTGQATSPVERFVAP